MGYEERQAEKARYYQAAAEKASRASSAAYEQSDKLADSIPFGQPILVGHHSEGRHRRDLDRIHRGMEKSLELGKKADYYAQKAANAANPSFISSDDENAISKLKEKLTGLEAKHEQLKAMPKADRESRFGWYALPYSSADIKRIKDRIATLEARQKMPEVDEQINGISLKTCKEENRVRLVFPSIPPEQVRAKLKQNGFRWSPYNGAWQRQISAYALELARAIAREAPKEARK